MAEEENQKRFGRYNNKENIYKQKSRVICMRKVMDKKGLSDIVTTLLIVLLGLAAVVLIWQIGIKPILYKGSAQIGMTTACMDVGIEATSCTYNTALNATVLYKRGEKTIDYNVSKVTLVFTLADGTSSSADVSIIPKVIETKSFITNALAKAPSKVIAVATLTDSAGASSPCSADAAVKVNCVAA
jgi:hypothetical protein